jgi:PAS domain S-box-containing protein
VKESQSIEDVYARLDQAEATIRAIQAGEVDAVVVNGSNGPQVYTLEGADHPYRVMVEQMHEGTVTLDSDLVILYSNRQFAALVGDALDAIAGSRFSRFLSDPDSEIFPGLRETALCHGHSSGELNLTASAGDVVPVRVSLTRLDVAGMETICVLVSDLREQRRNEAIVKEEQLSRLILEQAGEAIVVINPQGLIIRYSQSALNLAGQPILMSHFDHVFRLSAAESPLDVQRIVSASREFRRISGLETMLAQPGGGPCSLLFSSSPLWSQSKELIGCVVTLTDITQRKRAEEALANVAAELTQANSDLRQFAHSASHDLREPLRQLAVFSEVLQRKYQAHLDAEAKEIIQHSVDAAHRMETLLKGLLEYTHAGDAMHPSPASSSCDADEILRKTLGTFEDQIEETGAQILSEPLPRLKIHDVHLTQLFQNLIGNALKYRSGSPPVIRVAADPLDEMWIISVSDNGIGIAPEYQEQIFGLFQRLHGGGRYSGSGIGLAICQKIVQRYGGRIWVDSVPGEGSRFAFTLPGAERGQHQS